MAAPDATNAQAGTVQELATFDSGTPRTMMGIEGLDSHFEYNDRHCAGRPGIWIVGADPRALI